MKNFMKVLFKKRRRLKLKMLMKDQRIVFVVGLFIGALLAVIVHVIQVNPPILDSLWPPEDLKGTKKWLNYDSAPYDFAYEKWLLNTHRANSVPVDPDLFRYSNTSFSDNGAELDLIKSFVRDVDQYDPRTESKFLHDKINVACMIFPTDVVKATAIRDTWGSRCNSLMLASNKKLELDPKWSAANSSILVRNPANISQIPAKSAFALLCKSLRQLWTSRQDEIQWLLITKEDTFALPENLRFYVAPKNHDDNHYFGHAMKFWNVIYNWADAGYVLSKGTVMKMMDKFPTDDHCEKGGQYWNNADWYLGKHLSRMDIRPVDTRDHIGRSRFIGHSLKKLLFPGGVSLFERYWKDSLYLSPDGPHCCSNYAITFHLTTSTTRIFQLQYLYYHLRPFSGGGDHGNRLAADSDKYSMSRLLPALTMDEKLKQEALEKLLLDNNAAKLPKIPTS